MSLFFGDLADKNNDLSTYPYAFHRLFQYNTTILEVSPTFLPATTLAERCYEFMFDGCTSLVNAPVLPATTLAPHCYDTMFRSCKSLTTAPELPATTLTSYCYCGMFAGCTGLTTAPALPAWRRPLCCPARSGLYLSGFRPFGPYAEAGASGRKAGHSGADFAASGGGCRTLPEHLRFRSCAWAAGPPH